MAHLFAHWQLQIEQKIRSEKIGWWLHWGLYPISLLFYVAIRVRHWLYDRRFFAVKRAKICVVSVGNIVAGGVGKTPLIALLAELLKESVRVAISSRGYRSKNEKSREPKEILVENVRAVDVPEMAKLYGDEIAMWAASSCGFLLFSGAARREAATLAAKRGCDLLLLDDGMQHRKLARDFEIVVLDGADPFGGEYFLPRGLLREDPRRLKSADLIVVMGPLRMSHRARVAELSQAPVVCMKMSCVSSEAQWVGQWIGKGVGKKCALFCAIGNPERFVQGVRAMGMEVLLSHFFPDHTHPDKEVLEAFAKKAQQMGAEFLVCTEKDWVKLEPSFLQELALKVVCIRAKLEICENIEAFTQAINRVKRLAEEKR